MSSPVAGDGTPTPNLHDTMPPAQRRGERRSQPQAATAPGAVCKPFRSLEPYRGFYPDAPGHGLGLSAKRGNGR